ncbi:MAG: phosphatidylglycerophosphatase A [Burkholderiaceae bacterium]|jgi:phosphatidylglycerophosphatase A
MQPGPTPPLEAPSADLPKSPALPPLPQAIFLRHPAHFFALGAGSGLSPVGPGTAGTLWAWGSFLVLEQFFSVAALWFVLLLSFPLAVWACSRTTRALETDDHSSIVIDEIWAFWLVLLVLPRDLASDSVLGPSGLSVPPNDWVLTGLAFLLFRVFDILKPPPVGWLDRRVKGGLGVMVDDIAAAGLTLLVIAILVRLGVLV